MGEVAPGGALPAEVAPTRRTAAGLATAIAGCTVCAELAAARTRTVPGVLPTGAGLLLVGEAPGAVEDRDGLPFAGRSGALLDDLLEAAGTRRADVAVANVLKCRPPDNRTPRRGEVEACRPWLQQQLVVQSPSVVVAMGSTAAAWFFGTSARIGALRGRVHERDDHAVLVTYHPSAALRFGPNGAPRAALAEDLALAVRLADRAAVGG